MPIEVDHLERFNKALAAMSDEEIRQMNNEHSRRNAEDFELLKSAIEQGHCCYCDRPITHFSQNKPCLHWLLKPNGFRKKHFPTFFKVKGFREINTYVRWIANTQKVGQHINDLVEEKASNKFIEETIVYKNIEWSFSSSKSDRNGHGSGKSGAEPHYHFQMRVDGRVIINYNAFHIPFSEFDEFSFAAEAGSFDRMRAVRVHDIGMQDIATIFRDNEDFRNSLVYTEDESDAAFHTDILIQAEAGETISGDAIADLLEERERTGESMLSLAKRLKNVSIKSVTSPAAGVPKIAKRKGGRGKPKGS